MKFTYRILLAGLCWALVAGSASAQLLFHQGFYHAIGRQKSRIVKHGGNLQKINFRKEFGKEVARQHTYDVHHSLGEERLRLNQWKGEGNQTGIKVAYVKRMSEFTGEPTHHDAVRQRELKRDKPHHSLFGRHKYHHHKIKRAGAPSSRDASPIP